MVTYGLLCFSHITRTTTWEDPRKTIAAQVANQQQRSAELLNTPHPAAATSPQPPGKYCDITAVAVDGIATKLNKLTC